MFPPKWPNLPPRSRTMSRSLATAKSDSSRSQRICVSLYRVLLGNILTNYLLGIISKTSKSRECPKTSENSLMNFQNLGCLRRKAMESYTSIPSLDSCSWCVFMVFCVLRSRLVGQLIFHAKLGWTGFMVVCSFSLSTICFLSCQGVIWGA